MIEITNDIEQQFPNAFAKAREEKPWFSTRRDGFRVVPRNAKAGKYLVRFIKLSGRMFVECLNLQTMEPCDSEKGHRLCYHRARIVDVLTSRGEEKAA